MVDAVQLLKPHNMRLVKFSQIIIICKNNTINLNTGNTELSYKN